MTQFDAFDPLTFKQAVNSEAATNSVKREIKNILNSYVGWFDPFCELIQNALDSVEARAEQEKNYQPELWITINIKENNLTVTDNGVGLNLEQFRQFLAPNFSFKSGNTRGHKGVGATYLAYGFNRMLISTKAEDFQANGRMIGARKWLDDENPSNNPKVSNDNEGTKDSFFKGVDKGVSIQVYFDNATHPGNLDWIKAAKADQWRAILIAKTGLGAIRLNKNIRFHIKVIDNQGKVDLISQDGISYQFLYQRTNAKSLSIREIDTKNKEQFDKFGKDFTLPSKYQNLDIIHESWEARELEKLISLTEEEVSTIKKYSPKVSVEYTYSAKAWQAYNETLNVRANYQVLSAGIQLAANNMPQGESIQIPLQRYTGRQNQIHFVFHFENCSADLGRKGFSREITDFSKDIARKLTETVLSKYRSNLRPATGIAPDIMRQRKVSDWKKEMESHEEINPLILINENFFLPSRKVSITSIPTREQDVISLFNQLIAGGVIRGIKIMSTNERLTYDGLFRVHYDEPGAQHIFDSATNPLGVKEDIAKELIESGFRSEAKILEYKFSLDGLIEDLGSQDKNDSDIELVVVWETGEDYRQVYGITSLLNEENLSLRQFHGITHLVVNPETGHTIFNLVVLSEMVDYLNDSESSQKQQIKKYE